MDKADKEFQRKAKDIVTRLEKEGQKVQVLGSIKDGKIELDQSSLAELAENHPNARMVFVALNSPFDPVSSV